MTRTKSDADDFVQVGAKDMYHVDGFIVDAPCKITVKLSESSYLNIFEDFYTF